MTTPAWLREFQASGTLAANVVLWGNVHDLVLNPSDGSTVALPDLLQETYQELGFDAVIYADPIDGPQLQWSATERIEHLELPSGHTLPGLSQLITDLATGVPQISDESGGQRRARIALIVGFASRLIVDPSSLAQHEHEFFTQAAKRAHESVPIPSPHGAAFNQVVWLVDGERDLPLWFTTSNESVRMISVPRPDLGARRTVASLLSSDSSNLDAFAESTEGLTFREMLKVALISQQGRADSDVEEAVRHYRYGFSDNPWSSPERMERILDGEATLSGRVIGQQRAVRHALDTLMRSAVNMAGGRGKPRGVLFFAGPTGVGKTELAKAIAELVFGSEDSYIRFDMSEYSAPHSEARLIGAPPGYVGFDAGGQLTNGVREKPFSLLLFDEIDKAHDSILDKFLQILEDGRLTDGAGNTVSFSEAILVFTTNRGIRGDNGEAIVSYEDRQREGFEHIEEKVSTAISEFFYSIKRPELLNRFGRNITIFDFITPEVADLIFDQKLGAIQKRALSEHDVTVDFTTSAREKLFEISMGTPDLGGRGILNWLEATVQNPLSRRLFERLAAGNLVPETWTVSNVIEVDGAWSLTFS